MKILSLCCMLLLVQLGDGQAPTNRPSNGVQLYLPYENRIIPNFSMIYAGQFFDVDKNNDVVSDALWCQSANDGSRIGLWYYPNGTQVPLFTGLFGDSNGPRPIFSKRFTGQIALARNSGLSDYEGLYTCIIPDENGMNQTLVVGIYRTVTYNNNDGPNTDSFMQFSLVSTRDANPPVFTLTFNISDGPPTDINCTDGSNPFTIANGDLSRVVVDGPESVTQVTVTVRMRQAGTYQCAVFNARVPNDTIDNVIATNSSITVADTPTNLTATRLNTGLAHVQLSWSIVSGVAGYEVFYQLSNGSSSVMSAGTSTNTMLNITSGLSLYSAYDFFVVSYGSEGSTVLPSNHSNNVTMTFSTLVTVNLTATNTTITMIWTLSSFAPPTTSDYQGYRCCRRQCEERFGPNLFSDLNSSSYTFTGIDSGSYCIVGLKGTYGNKSVFLDSAFTITLSSVPSSSVSNITISSVEARSMTVLWDEVPCSEQNGPITGYLLYYTNTTFNDTVNITGGDNRQYNLTTLTPYTNYTVTVIAYNDGGTGPASSEVIQQTGEAEPGVVSDLILSSTEKQVITVTWNIPTIPNGIIIIYEIRYRESTSNGPYNITNTTNTQYTIQGLLSFTKYIIGVRAYISVGPGEWTDRNYIIVNVPNVEGLSIEVFDDTVLISWTPLNNTYLTSYIIQYKEINQIAFQKIDLPPSVSLVGLPHLKKGKEYAFQIFNVLTVNDMKYNGSLSSPVIILVTKQLLPTTIPSFCPLSSITITETILCHTLSSLLDSQMSYSHSIVDTATLSIDPQENCTGPLVGIAVVAVMLLVILSLLIGLLFYCHKRKKYDNTSDRESIPMTSSPAYVKIETCPSSSTTQEHYETVTQKSEEPLYDTTVDQEDPIYEFPDSLTPYKLIH